MNPLIKKLEERLLPEFEEIAEKIRREMLDVKVTVKSCLFGLPHKMHYCIINCSYGLYDDYDIELCVVLHLHDTPRINADVCWSTGYIEAEFYENWQSNADFPEVSEKILKELYKDLPRLYEALFEALKRQKPSNE